MFRKTHRHLPSSEFIAQKKELDKKYYDTKAAEEFKKHSNIKDILSAAATTIEQLLEERTRLTESKALQENELAIKNVFNDLSANKATLFLDKNADFLDHHLTSVLKSHEHIETRAATVIKRIRLQIALEITSLQNADKEVKKEEKTYYNKLQALKQKYGIPQLRIQVDPPTKSAFFQPKDPVSTQTHRREHKRETPFAKLGQEIAQSTPHRQSEHKHKGQKKA